MFDVDEAEPNAPLLSIFGGKITTYRRLAEQAVDILRPWFPRMGLRWTENALLDGGDLGVGGWAAPLTATLDQRHLVQELRLPVVLVVGMRLGCLNHALLTAEAIRAGGLTLAGWVANRIDPEMGAADENIAYLRARLNAPLLAEVPYQDLPEPGSLVFDLPKDWQ